MRFVTRRNDEDPELVPGEPSATARARREERERAARQKAHVERLRRELAELKRQQAGAAANGAAPRTGGEDSASRNGAAPGGEHAAGTPDGDHAGHGRDEVADAVEELRLAAAMVQRALDHLTAALAGREQSAPR